LEDEMQEAAGSLEFEKAAVIRDQIDSLKSGSYKKLPKAAARRIKPTRAGFGAGG
jgi:excinuclease ABC subunit B